MSKSTKKKQLHNNATLMPGKIQPVTSLRSAASVTGTANLLSTTKAPQKQQNQHAQSQQAASAKNSDTVGFLLEVTVIPVDEQPYTKQVQIPSVSGLPASSATSSNYASNLRGAAATSSIQTQQNLQYPSLKDLFQNSDSLWKPIFGSFVGTNKKPQFAIFRKPIERRGEIHGIKKDTELSLHILYLKRDITQFPRNAFANQIEVYCSKFFYGPLVVVFCDTKPPYKLHDFPPYYLIDEIEPLNELEQKCYPLPFGAKRCSLVRALMNEDRFTQNLDHLERVMSNHEFMLYCYKTSFCPISNSTIHDWSKCNYAHRQQDFRRPPYLFFYYPERCPHIGDDGGWESCEYELQCDYAHTLVEILFNPLHFKISECPEKISADKFRCAKHKERCCHAHSSEEKKLGIEVMESLVPKVLPQKEDIMQYYLEILPEYVQSPAATTAITQSAGAYAGAKQEANGTYASSEDGGVSTGNGAQAYASNSKSAASTAAASSTKTMEVNSNSTASAKKAKDQKAAANLEEESDLQRQKFLDTFQQMQVGGSPATQVQKTYKVKSEVAKVVAPTLQQSYAQALPRTDNPFQKARQIVVGPDDVASQNNHLQVVAEGEPTSGSFRPFEPVKSADSKSPSIFDKLDRQATPSQLIVQQMDAAAAQQIKVATAKMDKRLQRKKGKLVKGVQYVATVVNTTKKSENDSVQDETHSSFTLQQRVLTSNRRDSSSPSQEESKRAINMPQLILNKVQSTPQSAWQAEEETKGEIQVTSQSSTRRQATNTTKSKHNQAQRKGAEVERTTSSTSKAQSMSLHNNKQISKGTPLRASDRASSGSIKRNALSPPTLNQKLNNGKHLQANHNKSSASKRLKKGQGEATAAPKQSKAQEELADFELPQAARQSQEEDIRMVKLQLLKLQMQSLQVSEEDFENFYLQQISLSNQNEAKESQKPAQQHSLVPLLSSRSQSPRSPPSEEVKANNEEEKISATEGATNPTRPSRLKPSNDFAQQASQKSSAAVAINRRGDTTNAKNNNYRQQAQSQSQSQAAQAQARTKSTMPPAASQSQPVQQQQVLVGRAIPREQTVAKQLALAYSAIEVPDLFEAASMRLIALNFADLHRRRYHNANGGWGRQAQGQQARGQDSSSRRGAIGRKDATATHTPLDDMVRSNQAHYAATYLEASDEAAFRSSGLNSSLTGVAYESRTQLFGGLPSLQGIHNRLAGSGARGLGSWLFAFNWSLFPYPLLVWSANEVSESATYTWDQQRNCLWQISLNSTGRRPLLPAHENVPPIIRHIWGLPQLTAMSEGEEEMRGVRTKGGRMTGQSQGQQTAPSGMVPALAPLPSTLTAADSSLKPGAFRTTNPSHKNNNNNPQIYKKGKKTSQNSNNQAKFQSSDLNEQNKA